MDHTTTTDTDALLAEVDALLANSAATDTRAEALLATGSTAARIADLALQAQLAIRELDVQARYQRRIARAIGA
jgi:hypothetical protein